MSWDEAAQQTSSAGVLLAPVYDDVYQTAIDQLVLANSATAAWIGGRGRIDDNDNTWAWITRKLLAVVLNKHSVTSL